MNLRRAARFAAVAAFVASGAGAAENEFLPFAVNIIRAHPQSWPGYGVYLGEGYVLTAEHVAGAARDGDPSVKIAGKTLPARYVREGDFETLDLSLLRVDESALPPGLGLRMMPVCTANIYPGERVVSVTPDLVAPSRILSPRLLPADTRARFPTVIADVATTGNSGSGVFDPVHRCLMGIMSRKISVASGRPPPGSPPPMIDIAKYFVPAAQIAEFLRDARRAP